MRRWNTFTFDPLKLLFSILTIVFVCIGNLGAAIIFCLLAATCGFSITWRR